jgi:hypothetical protein
MAIELRPRVSTIRCALCHDDLTDEAISACVCGVVLHWDCRDSLRACLTIGCAPGVRVRVLVRSPLRSFLDYWMNRPMLLAFVLLTLTFLGAVVVSAYGSNVGCTTFYSIY